MSRNQDKNKEEKQIEYVEYNSMNEDEINYQNQYLKATEIIGQNNPELEECGIKINLEKIEERAPEEEESCICSIPATKERIKQSIRTEKQILKLKKLLKYKNILYYYFNKWKKKLSNSSVKKRIKKIKRKKKVKNIKYNIGDSFIAREMSNDTINENKNIENNIKKEKNNNYNQKIKDILKYLIQFGKTKKGLFKKYFNIWRRCLNNPNDIIKKKEEKKDFNANNVNKTVQRKDLKLPKKEEINSKQNKGIKKTFRISKSNNNIMLNYKEHSKSINLENDNNEEEEIGKKRTRRKRSKKKRRRKKITRS